MERARRILSTDVNPWLVNLAGAEDAKKFTRERGISTVAGLSGRPQANMRSNISRTKYSSMAKGS